VEVSGLSKAEFKRFRQAVRRAGATVKPLHPYEVARFKVPGGGRAMIITCSSKNRLSFRYGAKEYWEQFQQTGMVVIVKPVRKPVQPPPPPSRKIDLVIFADASMCRDTYASGWGAWIKRDDHHAIFTGGEMRELMTQTSSDAEMAAMANAVHMARSMMPDGGLVMLQTDCLRVLEVICTAIEGASQHAERCRLQPIRMKTLTAIERSALDVIRTVKLVAQVDFVVCHVRDHQSGGGGNWVNRQCDRIAREHMQTRRAKVLAGTAA
jgi:ribonuclease HI